MIASALGDGVAVAPPPASPFGFAVLGDGRVGGSLARALSAAGHRAVGAFGRDDDPGSLSTADVIAITVPDDALEEAAGVVARVGRPGTVVFHTSGIHGLEPLRDCGPLVAAIHPAVPVATRDHRFDGAPFGITAASGIEAWCDRLVVHDLGGLPVHVRAEDRVRYHAALAMASNFAVALVGDAAELAGGHDLLVPLLRATVENIDVLGPDQALTGPVVRGDAGTVRAHLRALPPAMVESYVVVARRALARARAAGRLDDDRAAVVEAALQEAMVP